jgi:anti-sigma regulatory factor (Ser/Thr protein kinase)
MVLLMKNKEKILQLINQKGRLTSEITGSIGVSRQYVNIVMSDLIAEKKVIKLGGTRNAFYVSTDYVHEHPDILPTIFKKKYKNISLEEHQVLMELEEKFPLISNIPENIKSIFTFAFSEMLNNAIEHSESKIISVEISLRNKKLSFIIEDSGVGVFRNIMKKKSLRSVIEAIQDLLKGKTTTMPKSHSGEGIFFTSKASDLFILDSFNHQLSIQTLLNDVKVKNITTSKRGTRVIFEISVDSELHLNDVFKKYTNLSEDSNHGFDKTEIRVKLFTTSGVHISRSQARRILSGLDKFKIILLDFDKVPVVGQAFADEIYRVFQNAHPGILIQEENMSEGVRFMVERAKNEAKAQR